MLLGKAGRGIIVDPIGYYIMIALLGAGAAYGLANKGKPKPKVTSGKKKAVIICVGIVTVCAVLAITVALLPHTTPPH
jgi:hypothetical protein